MVAKNLHKKVAFSYPNGWFIMKVRKARKLWYWWPTRNVSGVSPFIGCYGSYTFYTYHTELLTVVLKIIYKLDIAILVTTLFTFMSFPLFFFFFSTILFLFWSFLSTQLSLFDGLFPPLYLKKNVNKNAIFKFLNTHVLQIDRSSLLVRLISIKS